jgi:hypothetical protein
MDNWILDLILKLGVPSALVIYFIWRGSKREDEMVRRIQNLEEKLRNILVSAVKDSTDAMKGNSQVLTELVELLKKIPCLTCMFEKEKTKQ